MEDPGEEWEIEEYYSSSGEEGCKSTVSWILNRGMQLGKKVVITGVVISSAPLVLPPLVVVSALGFAVSVPFGVIFASYACTEKLMSKLLPIPASSPMLEYDFGLIDESEEETPEFAGEFVLEEVKEQIADMKERVEMRTELVEHRNMEQKEGHVLGDDSIMDIEEVGKENLYKDEGFKEKGYEEDVGEYLEGEDERSLGGTDIKIAGVEKEIEKEPLIEESKNEKPSPEVKRVVVIIEGEKKNANDVTKTDELVVVARGVRSDIRDVEKVTSNKEDKVLKEGTTGLLEKIQDEGKVAESMKKNKKKNKHRVKKSHGVAENKEDEHGKKTEEMDEKLSKELGKRGDETIPDAKQGKTKATAEGLKGEAMVINDGSSVLVSGKPAGYQKTLNNGNHAAKKSKIIDVELKPVAVEQGCRVDSIVSDKKEVSSIGSNAERRGSVVGGNSEKSGNEKNLVLENQAQPGFPESKHDGVMPRKDISISSKEISLGDEKIWEQINALRIIVGYKAAPQSSCIEEVKALYIFTGVEPPSSFDKSFDLKEAEDKLHFLMSIVGVK